MLLGLWICPNRHPPWLKPQSGNKIVRATFCRDTPGCSAGHFCINSHRLFDSRCKSDRPPLMRMPRSILKTGSLVRCSKNFLTNLWHYHYQESRFSNPIIHLAKRAGNPLKSHYLFYNGDNRNHGNSTVIAVQFLYQYYQPTEPYWSYLQTFIQNQNCELLFWNHYPRA